MVSQFIGVFVQEVLRFTTTEPGLGHRAWLLGVTFLVTCSCFRDRFLVDFCTLVDELNKSLSVIAHRLIILHVVSKIYSKIYLLTLNISSLLFDPSPRMNSTNTPKFAPNFTQ